MAATRRKKLAVWKFASCDGCQLSLLDCEDELLALAGKIDFAYFLEASSAPVAGPYDLSLVEGSITTAEDAERIRRVRRQSRRLVTIGACATAGGIQALRNFSDVQDFMSVVYATPEYVSTLATSTPISAHVPVDYELHGCPINKHQLLEVLSAYLNERRPAIPSYSVCVECKRRGNVCVRVRRDLPVVPPRLLRLLRADGEPEHPIARRLAPTARRLRPRPPSLVPDVPRHRRAVPRAERCPCRAVTAAGRSRPTFSPASRARAPCGS